MDNIIKGIEWRGEMIPFEAGKAGKILHFAIFYHSKGCEMWEYMCPVYAQTKVSH